MRTPITLTAAIGALLFAACDSADAPIAAREQPLDRPRQDATRAKRVDAIVARLDADGDGLISKEEAAIVGVRGERMLRDFDAVDTNGDGAVSKAELEARMTATRSARRRGVAGRMKKHDANGDGKLDETERAAMRAVRVEAMLARLDRDGDGGLGKDEATGRMLRDFDATDTDGNGVLTRTELEARMSARRRNER